MNFVQIFYYCTSCGYNQVMSKEEDGKLIIYYKHPKSHKLCPIIHYIYTKIHKNSNQPLYRKYYRLKENILFNTTPYKDNSNNT